MKETKNLDNVRKAALDTVERSQKMYIVFILFGAVIESLLLLGFIFLADFSNRLHVLLLMTTVASYSIIIMGLFALGFYLKSNILRILKAIEILGESMEGNKN